MSSVLKRLIDSFSVIQSDRNSERTLISYNEAFLSISLVTQICMIFIISLFEIKDKASPRKFQLIMLSVNTIKRLRVTYIQHFPFQIRTDRLMTLLPLPPDCVALEELPPSECPQGVLMELFGSLQHPYIYPVLDLGFFPTDSNHYACLVMPFNARGSLKDLIYKVITPFL